MPTFFPKIESYKTMDLKVEDDPAHTLNIRLYGNPKGKPVVVNHGGPGAACPDDYARYFDPEKYNIILYDQRGCGKSTPLDNLKKNTSQHLVNDITKILDHLKIDKAMMFGGSWGATLSILYAQAQPKRTSEIVLRGTFIGRDKDLQAFLHEESEAAKKNPDEWKKFKAAVFGVDDNQPKTFKEIIEKYEEKACFDDPNIWHKAAKAFVRWETVNSFANTNSEEFKEEIKWSETPEGLTMGRLEVSYIANRCFLKPNQILKDTSKLIEHQIPIKMIQGVHDDICPKDQTEAFYDAIKKQDPNYPITINYTNAGHSGGEKPNVAALVTATNSFVTPQSKASVAASMTLGITQQKAKPEDNSQQFEEKQPAAPSTFTKTPGATT